MTNRTCKVEDCGAKIKGHGLCSKHYQRWKRHGSVERSYVPESERFWSKVDKLDSTGCWQWIGTFYSNGYGMFAKARNGSKRPSFALAHRYSYEAAHGAIPGGLVLDHLCRNRGCVNPDHLEPVTVRENLLRGEGFIGKQYRITHCLRANHPLFGENLYITPDGERACRECRREASRRRYAKTATA